MSERAIGIIDRVVLINCMSKLMEKTGSSHTIRLGIINSNTLRVFVCNFWSQNQTETGRQFTVGIEIASALNPLNRHALSQ